MGGVRADVATLVVGVDSQVETHELNEILVLSEAELVGKIVTVILILLRRRNFAVFVDVAVYARGDVG